MNQQQNSPQGDWWDRASQTPEWAGQPSAKNGKSNFLVIAGTVAMLALVIVAFAAFIGSPKETPSLPGVAASAPPADAVDTARESAYRTAAPTPTQAPKPVYVAPTSVSAGTYQVGSDIAAGRWKTSGSTGNCYYARAKNDSGELSSIITNKNFEGPNSLTVNKGEFVSFSGDCVWSKVG